MTHDPEDPPLPDNIVDFTALRIKRGAQVGCLCQKGKRRFDLDVTKREITCQACGNVVDPFEVLAEITEGRSRVREEIAAMLEQKRAIQAYKPHLVVIKSIERQYRGKAMLPTCPHCHHAIFLEELERSAWVNRRMEELRRERDSGPDKA